MRPAAARVSNASLLPRRRSLSTLCGQDRLRADPALSPPRPSPALACAGRDLALEVNCGSLCARDHATMDLDIAARRQLAEMGKAATEVGRRTLGMEHAEAERVRCSSLVDWPVYPRFAHTMRAPVRRHVATRGRSLVTSSSLVLKIRRLAGISRLGDDDAVTSLGNHTVASALDRGWASDDGHQLTWKKETEQCYIALAAMLALAPRAFAHRKSIAIFCWRGARI